MLDTRWKKHLCLNLNLCSLYALKWFGTMVVVPVITKYLTTTQWECCQYLNNFCISLSYTFMTLFERIIFARTWTSVHLMHWNDSVLQLWCRSLWNTWPHHNENAVSFRMHSASASHIHAWHTCNEIFVLEPQLEFISWIANDSALQLLWQSWQKAWPQHNQKVVLFKMHLALASHIRAWHTLKVILVLAQQLEFISCTDMTLQCSAGCASSHYRILYHNSMWMLSPSECFLYCPLISMIDTLWQKHFC